MDVPRVEVVVLGLLAEKPVHGYELIQRFRALGMDRWAGVGRASIYQALRRLEERGFVRGRAGERLLGPDRRVYRVTRPGRDRLARGLSERLGDVRTDEGLVALAFLHLLPADEARHGLAAREAALQAAVTELEAARGRLKAVGGPANLLGGRALDLQLDRLRVQATWLAVLRRDLHRIVGGR